MIARKGMILRKKANIPKHGQTLYQSFQKFLGHLKVKGCSLLTVQSYESTYRRYCLRFGGIDDERVSKFLDEIDNLNTRNKTLSHLLAYATWAGIPLRLRSVKLPQRIPKVVPEDVSQKWINTLEKNHKPAWAVIVIMKETGMRIGEVIGLRPENLYENADDSVPFGVKFIGKGNKERQVPLTPEALEAVKCWVSLKDRPGVRAIRYALRRAEEEAGVDHIKPHWFRSSMASKLVNNGVSFEDAAEFLGHSSASTLRQFYARMSHERLSQIVMKAKE